MAFDLNRIADELAQTPLLSPWSVFAKQKEARGRARVEPDVAIAVVDDTFRLARIPPVPAKQWDTWRRQGHKLWEEQVGMLAHALASTSLRPDTVAALEPSAPSPQSVLDRFFAGITPLSAEMIRSNRFRQEEFLRNWIAAIGGKVAGETAKESRQRLEQLDYAKSLEEFKRAEAARKAEADKRAQALREAQEREAAARGWRE